MHSRTYLFRKTALVIVMVIEKILMIVLWAVVVHGLVGG
jgi:hypothetical protein